MARATPGITTHTGLARNRKLSWKPAVIGKALLIPKKTAKWSANGNIPEKKLEAVLPPTRLDHQAPSAPNARYENSQGARRKKGALGSTQVAGGTKRVMAKSRMAEQKSILIPGTHRVLALGLIVSSSAWNVERCDYRLPRNTSQWSSLLRFVFDYHASPLSAQR
jgi:hypothetical protein